MRIAVLLLTTVSAVTWLDAQENSPRPSFISPDKKWEFRVEGNKALLMKSGSNEPGLDLSESIGGLALETGKIVWAPDSRRFAFNTRKGGKYYGSDLYELAGNSWQKLPSAEDAKKIEEMIDRGLRKEKKRLGAKPHATLNSVMNLWRVRRWLDNDTFEAYAGDEERVLVHEDDEEPEYLGCAVLYRAKCDNRGGWKVISARELSAAEVEKVNKEDGE